MTESTNTVNLIADRYDGKKTMHYCLMFFLVGWITAGIAWFVWWHRISNRIGAKNTVRLAVAILVPGIVLAALAAVLRPATRRAVLIAWGVALVAFALGLIVTRVPITPPGSEDGSCPPSPRYSVKPSKPSSSFAQTCAPPDGSIGPRRSRGVRPIRSRMHSAVRGDTEP